MNKEFTKEFLKSKLTPREAIVMCMLSDGISVSDIHKSGKIKTIEKGTPVKSRQHIYMIRNKAIRKLSKFR